MEKELDAKRRTFLWACGWSHNVRTGLWDSPTGTERTHMMLDQAVREQFRRNEEALLDMAAGHAWDWSARHEDLRLRHEELRDQVLKLLGSVAVLSDALRRDETP
mgnify:CR=1 FL=1